MNASSVTLQFTKLWFVINKIFIMSRAKNYFSCNSNPCHLCTVTNDILSCVDERRHEFES